MSQPTRVERIEHALAECLAALPNGEAATQARLAQHPDHSDELAELVSLAHALTALSAVAPRRAFLEEASRQLIARLPDRKAPVQRWLGHLAPRGLWQLRLPVVSLRVGTLISALVVLAIVVGLTHGILHAAASAGPGDWLYPLHVKADHLPLLLAPDAEAAARLRLTLAGERLAEAQGEIEAGDRRHVPLVLHAYETEMAALAELLQEVEEPQRSVVIELWGTARLDHVTMLKVLLEEAAEEDQDAIREALDVWVLAGDPDTALPFDLPTDAPEIEIPRDGGNAPETPAAPAEVAVPDEERASPPEPSDPPQEVVVPPAEGGPPGGLPDAVDDVPPLE
ncbi:MAG: hypothetical protein JXC32_22450, partial [Anaerolineae bacterium]|nr:hypothetical protein [Anaerolineae bacterium]